MAAIIRVIQDRDRKYYWILLDENSREILYEPGIKKHGTRENAIRAALEVREQFINAEIEEVRDEDKKES